MAFTIAGEKILAIDVLSVPERLRRLATPNLKSTSERFPERTAKGCPVSVSRFEADTAVSGEWRAASGSPPQRGTHHLSAKICLISYECH
jgi:hypothetical protein